MSRDKIIARLFAIYFLCVFVALASMQRTHAQIVSGGSTPIVPSQITVPAVCTATSSATPCNSGMIQFFGSLWNGSQAVNDQWWLEVFENSCALTCGSDFEVNHSSVSGGSGRFHVNSDFLVGPPGSATSSANFNSFAWDNQGEYWDGSEQHVLWEIANGVTPASGSPVNSRENIYPIFSDACAGCTADIAFGASGTNPGQGNPAGPPMFDWIVLPRDGFTITFTHDIGGLTGDRSQWFPDKSGPIGIAFRHTCTLVAGTCTVTFGQGPYISAPICSANGQTVANAFAVSSTTSAVTITSSSGSDTQVANIVCVENGEN